MIACLNIKSFKLICKTNRVINCSVGALSGLECRFVGHRGEVGPELSWKLGEGVAPEVVTHEGKLLSGTFSLLNVKLVAATEEWLVHPWVLINTVDAGGSLLPVDDHSLVHAWLVSADNSVSESLGLFTALNNFDFVLVDLTCSHD